MCRSNSRICQTGRDAARRPARGARMPRRQCGAFGVMTAVLLLVILAFCGVAIELGRIYNRKAELQSAADIVALAAATRLNGTPEGVNAARSAAEQAASSLQYAYSTENVGWSNDAIRFGAAPDGATWLDPQAAAQSANAPKMFFVRIDTARLQPRHGRMQMAFLRVFAAIPDAIEINSVATAGRSSVNILPLALCAMSAIAADKRETELVEYGFRRGISYNLMKLNPDGNAAGAHYLVNPFTLPGASGASVMDRLDAVKPFVCTGTLAVPTLAGGAVTVEPGFPLNVLHQQLNSRFGAYHAPCQASTAPPDANVKQFDHATTFPWLNSAPTGQSAESRQYNNRLVTVADIPKNDLGQGTTGGMYGPLWIFARPVVKDALYTEGGVEPSTGYTRFEADKWPTLYPPQQLKAKQQYPITPYTTAAHIQPPALGKGVLNRRVLNVPLLRCPVTAGLNATSSAEVVAIGRFFMTVSASASDLHAEFAGLAHPSSLSGDVELYP